MVSTVRSKVIRYVLMASRYSLLALGIALMVLLIPNIVQACPLCVEALKDSNLGRGFNTRSVVVCISMYAGIHSHVKSYLRMEQMSI